VAEVVLIEGWSPAMVQEWAAEKRKGGLCAEARELERLAAVHERTEVLPRGSRVPCDCPRVVDRRPGDRLFGIAPGDESITVWHRPECEGRERAAADVAWTGELVDGDGENALVLWRCSHEHADRHEAERCAVGELNGRSRRRPRRSLRPARSGRVRGGTDR
jgi:hypothetical protein